MPGWCRDRLAALRCSSEDGWQHSESGAALHRRRRVVAGVLVAGAGLLGASLSTRPGSPRFYGLALSLAATWTVGGLVSGPLHLGRVHGHHYTLRRPVRTPLLIGAGAFAVFYGCARVAVHVPTLNRSVASILRYDQQGSSTLVQLVAAANAAAEEIFFRGALYAAIETKHPVAVSTAIYSLATIPTRNLALVLTSAVMGTLFGVQRQATGGIQAPLLSHLIWSTLMLHFLPPLFRGQEVAGA